jgi:hypothetical protein
MSAGLFNTALGQCALNTPGTQGCNTAIGFCALSSATVSSFNTAVGNQAGKIVSGNHNTFIGNRAGGGFALSFGQSQAVAIGSSAMANSTGSGSVAIGFSAGNFMTGNFNAGVGGYALHGDFGGMTGALNAALGEYSGCALSSGTGNVSVGFATLCTANTGSYNTASGYQSLRSITTGSNNVAIGCNAGTIISGETSGLVNLTTENNRIVMGNFNHTCAQIKIAWTATSDVRDKAIDPAGVPYGLEFINQIDPIAYRWCDRDTNEITDERLRYGFSAQNLLALETETPEGVIISDDNPDCLQLTDQHLLPVLVNAIKELSAKNDELEARLRSLEIPG